MGASTVPEKLACYISGMKKVTFSTASSPSAGMSNGQIDGDEVLQAGVKSVENLAKILDPFIAKIPHHIFENKRPKVSLMAHHQKSINTKRLENLDVDVVTKKIVDKVQSFAKDKEISRVVWLMSDNLVSEFFTKIGSQAGPSIYFINLKDIAELRSRSCKLSPLNLITM